MSDIDRRPHVSMMDDVFGPDMEPDPSGKWFRESAVRELVKVLRLLKRGDCWCEVGIGNPMLRGKHTQQCLIAQELLVYYKGLLDEN